VRALGAAADARGLVLMARHPLRFAAPARAAKEEVRAGAAGTIRHARVRALRRDRIPTLPGMIDRELAGGGVALDLGVHALDIALWLMDFPRAATVSGSVRTRYGHDENFVGRWGAWDRSRFTVEDTASGAVSFENGMTLSIECAWAGDHPPEDEGLSCTLYGDAGVVHWAAGETREDGVSTQSSTPEFLAFADAVRSGGPSPVPWRETLQSIAILEALYRSAEQDREVAVY
jgi:predicted dehydrogenase